jgi:hypothetical protein
MIPKLKEYEVKLIGVNQLQISGKGDDLLWDSTQALTDFCSPWKDEKQSEIKFKALWDREYLFFSFTVFDTAIHIEKTGARLQAIGNSDRVELFFRSDSTMNPYYCLEMDTEARIMDFVAYPGKIFDFDWNWPEESINVKSAVNSDSFTVEGAIRISSLNHFNLIKNNTIETGIFRAKYSQKEDFSFDPTWITWVNPNTETPNFHLASSFGTLILKE